MKVSSFNENEETTWLVTAISHMLLGGVRSRLHSPISGKFIVAGLLGLGTCAIEVQLKCLSLLRVYRFCAVPLNLGVVFLRSIPRPCKTVSPFGG